MQGWRKSMGAVINVNTTLFLNVIIQPQPKKSPQFIYIPRVWLFMVTFTFVYSAFVHNCVHATMQNVFANEYWVMKEDCLSWRVDANIYSHYTFLESASNVTMQFTVWGICSPLFRIIVSYPWHVGASVWWRLFMVTELLVPLHALTCGELHWHIPP